jgi:hypothetical protein
MRPLRTFFGDVGLFRIDLLGDFGLCKGDFKGDAGFFKIDRPGDLTLFVGLFDEPATGTCSKIERMKEAFGLWKLVRRTSSTSAI